MGTTLTGTTPQDTYDSLIKVTDNGPIGTSLKTLTDGLGNDSALALSSRGLKVNQSATLITDTASLCHFSNNYLYLRGGSAGLSIGDDAFSNSITLVDAGEIRFEAGSAERMRITSTGLVGIGLTNPNDYNVGANDLVIGGGAFKGMTIAATTEGNINFADGTSGVALYRGSIGYNHTSDALYFYSASLERMRITSAGVVDLAQGQIKFPVTQVASADPNTLDDYEEGTWTPVLVGAGTAGTYEQATTYATYTKIGRQVTLNCYVQLAGSITGGGTGYAIITGIPFAKSANQQTSGSVFFSGVDFTGSFVSIIFQAASSSSNLYFSETVDNSGAVDLPISGFSANDVFSFSITYNV